MQTKSIEDGTSMLRFLRNTPLMGKDFTELLFALFVGKA